MSMKTVFNEVLDEISLSNSEEKHLEEVSKKIISLAKKKKLTIIPGGSLAKKTLVKKEKQDIDLFAVFKNEKEMNEFYKKISSLKLNAKRVHGSRDYFQIQNDNVLVEIIPVLKIKGPKDARNITDFSLSHVNYVKSQISKNKKLSDEIKLAKTFCHAQNCYGAESFIGGFSGYALEVLIIHYGSFKKFLKELQKKRIIDPKRHFRNDKMILNEINESKLKSPLIVIDPTYKYRNVCASLKPETFNFFLEVSKEFLKKPSKDFFKKKEFEPQEFKKISKKKKAKLISLNLSTDRQEGDIAATKMKKFFDYQIEELERKEQKVLEKEFVYNDGKKAVGYIIVKEKNEIIVKGPEQSLKKAVKEFKKKNKTAFKKKKFFYAKRKISLKEILQDSKKVAKEMQVSSSGIIQ